MAKRQLYYAEAERLYTIEQCTLSEIASRTGVSERTLRHWKQQGGWDEKRRNYLASRRAFHEELYEFARKLMASIREDMDEGRKVDPGRLYAFTRILPLITKVKDYEEVTQAKDAEKKPLTAEELTRIIQEAMGIA